MEIVDFFSMVVMVTGRLGYVYAAKNFCKKYLKVSVRNGRLFEILLFGGWMVMNIVYERFPIPYIVYALLYYSFFTGLVIWLFEADKEKKILAASILITVSTLTANLGGSVLSCLILMWLHTVKQIPEPFFGEWEFCLLSGIGFIMEIGSVHWMKNHLDSVFDGKTRKWYILSAIPLFFVIAVIETASWGACNGIMIRSGGSMGTYYDQIFSNIEFMVLSMLSLLGAGFYLFGMDRIYLEQRKSGQYHAQIAAYKMLEEQYSRLERLRHDMKNHMIALTGLTEKKEWEKIDHYLRKMTESGGLGSGEEITGNRAVDALLYQKRKLAETKNILWECDVQMPETCCVNEFDLCVLFGNILDNAVEACERSQRNVSDDRALFIKIQAKVVKKYFLLEVKNSNYLPRGCKEDSLPKRGKMHTSGKERPAEHGIGLLNVKDAADRYNGIMRIETQDGVFEISVMIPLIEAGYDIKSAV